MKAGGRRTGAGLAVNPSWAVKPASDLAASWVASAAVAGILDGGGSSQGTSEVLPLIWGESEGLQLHWSIKKIFALLNGLENRKYLELFLP